MNKQFGNRFHLPSEILWLLLIIGVASFFGWRISQARHTPNLLTNPDFAQADTAWQIVAVGEAQAVPKPATVDRNNPILELTIPDTVEGSGAGVGQRLAIISLHRYKFTANFRFVDTPPDSVQTLLRLSQFNRAGELIKQDEILNPPSLTRAKSQPDWHSLTHTLITDGQAVEIELGVGFFSSDAARVEIDSVMFQVYPPWFNAILADPVAVGALLVIVGLIGYKLGQNLWPIRRKVMVNGGLIIASLFLTIMMLEVVVRFIPIRLVSSHWPRGYHVPFAHGQSYRLAKNYPSRIITNEHGDRVEIVSNALGARDIEVPSLTDETWLVLILGDSMTFGVVGNVTESWPRRLDEQVAEIGSEPEVYHFINGGVSGYNTFQEVLLFDALLKDMAQQGLKPKVALLSFFSEIWGRNLYGPAGRFTVINDVVMYSSLRQAIVNLPERLIKEKGLDTLLLPGPDCLQSPHQALLSKSRLYFLLSLFLTLRFEDDWDARPENVDPVAVNYEALKAFKTMAETNGIQPVVVYLPKHDTFAPANLAGHQEMIGQMEDICRRLDLPLLNPYHNMQQLGVNGDNAGEKLTLGYDSHYSVQGNLLYAKALAPLMVEYLAKIQQLPTAAETESKQ
ncbi:MAG: hypothetical protein JW953_15815 [Anaerolineae bacterium]|nr:hypothetical protein [Anaerolineae bacterium]